MRLQMFHVNTAYCEFLSTYDPCVPYISEDKKTRPFIGIVIQIDDYSFYAPLSSPKTKHLNMKDMIDFIKINNGIWGAINLNNMIPVHPNQVISVDIRLNEHDDKDLTAYKHLLNNQLDWCNQNYNTIITKAKLLYRVICNKKAPILLKNRCCDFQKDIQLLKKYMETVDIEK